MRAAREHIQEINRLYETMNKSKSYYLKNDYSKRIHRMKKELKTYCKYRGYNYHELMKGIFQ